MIQVTCKTPFIFAVVITLLASLSWASDEGTMIIDVRSDREWQAGHLATAVHLPLNNIAQDIEGLVDNKQQKIYLSIAEAEIALAKAVKILQSLGYSHVINAGGIAEASDFLDQPIVAD